MMRRNFRQKNKKAHEITENSKASSIKDDKIFTPEKVEDDKRLLDFFTSFFSTGDDSENVSLDELNKDKRKNYRPENRKSVNETIPEKRSK